MQPARSVGYAHRGFAPDGAENTMRAFRAAYQLGFRQLETDIRVTADGIPVLFHDPVLDRLTNHTGPLRRRTWAELADLRVAGAEPIPRLTDLLTELSDCFINLDLKVDEAIGPTLDVLRDTGSWRRVRLASFSHRRLLAARQAAGPDVASALSPPEVAALLAGRTGRLPAGAKLAAQVPVPPGPSQLLERLIRQAHRQRIEVHAWTVNDAARQTLAARPRGGRDHHRPARSVARRADRARAVAGLSDRGGRAGYARDPCWTASLTRSPPTNPAGRPAPGTARWPPSRPPATGGRISMPAHLKFFYGPMDCGKSTLALQIDHNHARQGRQGLLLTRYDRSGGPSVTTRVGLSRDAIEVTDDLDLRQLVFQQLGDSAGGWTT